MEEQVLVPKKVAPSEIKEILKHKMLDYKDSLESLRQEYNLTSIEKRSEHLKNKIQSLSLDLLSDLTIVSEWKLTFPKYLNEDFDTFLNFVNQARWLLSLFNSTESIY